MGSATATQSLARAGMLMPVFSLMRFGPAFFAPDFVSSDSSLPLHAFAWADLLVPTLDPTKLELLPPMQSFA